MSVVQSLRGQWQLLTEVPGTGRKLLTALPSKLHKMSTSVPAGGPKEVTVKLTGVPPAVGPTAGLKLI